MSDLSIPAALVPLLDSGNAYTRAAVELAVEHRVRVNRWRSSNSGVAYTSAVENVIEAPLPRGPISFGVFAHEIGHHVLHKRNGSYPRWREEVEAWEFALKAIQRFGLKGYERVERMARPRIHRSFFRAIRRGVDPDKIAEAFPAWWDES